MGVRKAFTADEDNYIRENLGRLSLNQLAQVLERPKSSVQYRIKTLGLEATRHEVPKVEDQPVEPEGRMRKLCALRDIMEGDILGGKVPMMQRAAYFREYRALLAEISELEGKTDAERESKPENSLGAALSRLAEQQRRLLEQAAES